MVSSASDLLKVELQGTGDNDGTWGTKNNTVLSRLEEAIADLTNITITGAADYTLDDTQYAEHDDATPTSESHCAGVKMTGTLTANQNVIVPSRNRARQLFWNATSGSYTVTVKTAAGSGVEIPQGTLMEVLCDGTNVKAASVPITPGGLLASRPLYAHLTFHSWVVTTGTLEQLDNANVTIVGDSATLWDTSNDQITVPAGYTFMKMIATVTCANTGVNLRTVVRKNGTSNTGSLVPPLVWEDVDDGTSGVELTGTVTLVDAVTTGDDYTIHCEHNRGSDMSVIGEVYVELYP